MEERVPEVKKSLRGKNLGLRRPAKKFIAGVRAVNKEATYHSCPDLET